MFSSHIYRRRKLRYTTVSISPNHCLVVYTHQMEAESITRRAQCFWFPSVGEQYMSCCINRVCLVHISLLHFRNTSVSNKLSDMRALCCLSMRPLCKKTLQSGKIKINKKIFKIKANKDSTFKAKAPTFKAKDFRCVLKDSSRPRAKDNNTG